MKDSEIDSLPEGTLLKIIDGLSPRNYESLEKAGYKKEEIFKFKSRHVDFGVFILGEDKIEGVNPVAVRKLTPLEIIQYRLNQCQKNSSQELRQTKATLKTKNGKKKAGVEWKK